MCILRCWSRCTDTSFLSAKGIVILWPTPEYVIRRQKLRSVSKSCVTLLERKDAVLN